MLKKASFVLTSALAFGGCAISDGGDPAADCYPGDVDCSDSAGGKAEEWDYRNDPERLANNLNYRLAELPRSGEAENPVWAASYWPTYQGSTNHRWQGSSVLSPLEKFDAAFHGWSVPAQYATSVPADCGPNAATEYGAYVEALGPAAAWQSTAQSRHLLFNGNNDDPDEDQDIDECHEVIETWWGLCHAWAPAAILEPEPLRAVEYNGQRFEVSDIKALILTVYDDTESLFLGGRCNAQTIEHDDTGRATATECRDTNAGAWHVVVTNFLGVNGRSFVEDRTAGYQVWNQPMVSYEVTQLDEITVARANELLNVDGDEYIYNDNAETLYEVQMTSRYLTEGHQSTQPLGQDGYVRSDRYHYILEVDADGKIAGGEWVGSSIDNHPDFLWSPVRARTGWTRSNPNVDIEQVHMLLEMSRAEDGGDQPTGGQTFSSDSEVAIPDNEPAGASSSLTVDLDATVSGLSVSVDITHTYVGDLVVTLSNGTTTVTLQDREGGSADDLVKTWTVNDFDGQPARGTWTLTVSDNAGVDTGTLNGFSLTFLE